MFRSRFAAAAALALLGSAGHSQTAPPVRTVQLYSYGYNPDPIVLTAGKPVTLNFVNRAGKGHDFTAPRFFTSSKILPTAGRYKVHCGKPFHKVMGMRGDIVVR